MTAPILLGLLFGLGAILVLTAQPYGRPQPSLKSRLEALRPDRNDGPTPIARRVFRTDVFELGLRPGLETAGQSLCSLLSSVGFDLSATSARLRLLGDHGGLALFLGQKLAAGIVGFALLPTAASISLTPSTPIWLWLAAGTIGFVLPDLMLRAKAEARRLQFREELAHFTDLVALAVSGGLGLESALEEAIEASGNEFSAELRRYLREARLRQEPPSSAIARLGEETQLDEAEPLATALATAEAQGIPVSQVLRAQARALRERRRIELIEGGEKAQTRMALPIGLLIVPAFLIVILYPSAVQLLQITK
jgi:tight adherence protein C